MNERLGQPAAPPWDGAIPKSFKLSSDDELIEARITKKAEKQCLINVQELIISLLRLTSNPVVSKIPALSFSRRRGGDGPSAGGWQLSIPS